MADLTYNLGRTDLADGTYDFINDVIKGALVASGYVPNKNDDYMDDGGANDPIDEELDGTGYAKGFAGSGRKTLSMSVVEDDANDRAEITFTAITWTGIDAGTADAFIMYHHITSDTASTLIAYNDSGGWPIVLNGGDLTVTPDAQGFIQFT